MSEQQPQKAPSSRCPSQGIRGTPFRSEDVVPPTLPKWKKWVLLLTCLGLFAALVYIGGQLCIGILPSSVYCTYIASIFPSSVYCTYIALWLLLVGIIFQRYLRDKILVHDARIMDPSDVDGLLVDAYTVEPRSNGSQKRPENYDEKIEQLNDEIKRLKELNPRGWTEFQVLPLNQLLVDFLKPYDLKARAQLSLAELEEYAEDSAYRYDRRQYDQWQSRINEAIKEVENVPAAKDSLSSESNEIERDKAGEKLRADLRALLEHVASYRADWARGSVVLRGLMIYGAIAIPILLAMGFLPVLHPVGSGCLRFYNWGFLAIVGALTAVLLDLRKSDLVEVGNTEGKKELLRAILAAVLGLVAGVLTYSLFSGDLLSTGAAVPEVDSPLARDIGLSIVWAIASGFSFERIFDRMRSATVGGG